MLRACALLLLLGSAGCDGCSQRTPPAPVARAAASAVAAPSAREMGPERGPAQRELTWSFESTPVGRMRVVLSVPPESPALEPPPVLIALHGRGEAFKGVDRGARGWIDDYWLDKAVTRLSAPPLTTDDFLGFVEQKRLNEINSQLAQRAYRGLIVACPYTPDLLRGDRGFEMAAPLASFIVDQLLPRIARELGGGRSAPRVGIDGVSLGGRAALLVGFERPSAFAAVGSLQAAFDTAEVSELTRRALAARRGNPKLSIRLLTSSGDYYRRALTSISQAFARAGVDHDFVVVPGPHDYDFNRGPGAYEMLLLHDRALRD